MNFSALLVLLYWIAERGRECEADPLWTSFASTQLYSGLRMVTDPNKITMPVRLFGKEGALIWARLECMYSCELNQSCQAFSFYENATAYVCEMLADNLCSNRIRKAFVAWPGSSVWDRTSAGAQKSCLEMRSVLTSELPCEILRHGCLGSWPNCYNCTQTCIDCAARGITICTLWPDGDGPGSVPIFGLCSSSSTFLLRQRLNPDATALVDSYQMSFPDISRLYQLQAYTTLTFFYKNLQDHVFYCLYTNSSIDDQGILSNMIFNGSMATEGELIPEDFFQLNGQALGSVPFITVTDDIYGCGSFWLLDPSNQTHCPGGNMRMLGTLNVSTEVRSGIRYPGTLPANEVFKTASILLQNQ